MQNPNLPINNVMTMVNDEFQHRVKYCKAWRGKQLAVEEVYGKWSTTYAELPMFMTALAHANPGSAVLIDAVPHERLPFTSVCKRVFWCLKATMDGWKHARPVLSIDGTFLKGPYNGKLLIAMGVDGNNHQYPVCFGLVDEESEANWSWFLQLLRQQVCRERMGVCIISDRAGGILAAVRNPTNGFAPPYGVHRFCLFHLRSNFCSKHPGGELKELVWLAGITPQVKKHNAYMKRIGDISAPALQYLAAINLELWAMCYDVGGARYGQATTNIMEGFNGTIRMARFLPVTAMMEYVFYRIVTIVNKERNRAVAAMQENQQFSARINDTITRYIKKASSHKVTTYSQQQGIFSVITQRYRVRGGWKGGHTQNVNTTRGTCTCGKWTCHHMPCSHVIAGCMLNGVDWKQWIDKYHTTSELNMLWEPLIYPLAPREYWNFSLPMQWELFGTLVADEALKKKKRKRGRRGESVRIHTEMDQSRSGKKCSRCKQEGHTKRSKMCPLRPNVE